MDSHYSKDFDNFFDGSAAKSGEAPSSSSSFNQGSSFNEPRRNSTTITTHTNTDTRHNLLHNIAAATPTPGSTTISTPTNLASSGTINTHNNINSNNNNSNNNNNNNNINNNNNVNNSNNSNNGAGLLGNNTTDFSMDDTPAILLEQLAYIDTFMPQLEEDITSYQMQHSGENQPSSVSGVSATTGNVGNNQYAHVNSIQFGNYVPSNTDNNINMFSDQNSIFNIDDRLAAELSVFADETFIFPDEDKHDHDNINSNNINALNYNNSSSSTNNNNNNTSISNSGNHFSSSGNMFNPNSLKENSKDNNNTFNKPNGHLADRRNNMLSKQYDLSRKRISSKHKSQYDNSEHGNSVSSPAASPAGSPAGGLLNRHDMNTFDTQSDNSNTISNSNTTTSVDHGGFVNFDVSDRTSRTPPLVPSFNSSLPALSFPNAATFASSASSAFSLPNTATTAQSDSRELSTNDLSTMNLSELLQFMKHPLHGNKHKMYAGLPEDCYAELTETFGFSDSMINALLYLIEYYHSNFLNFDKNDSQDGLSSVLSPGSNLKLDAYKQSLLYKNAHSLAMIIKAGTLQSNPTTQFAAQQDFVSTNDETYTSNNNNNSSDGDNSAIDGALREEEQDKSEQPESSTESGQPRETSADQVNKHVTAKRSNDISENKTAQSSAPRVSSVVAEDIHRENHSHEETSDAETGDTLTERESSTPPTTSKNKVTKPPNKFKKLEDLEEKVTELLKVSTSLHQKVKTLELENSLLKKLVKDKGEFSSIEEVENLYNGNK